MLFSVSPLKVSRHKAVARRCHAVIQCCYIWMHVNTFTLTGWVSKDIHSKHRRVFKSKANTGLELIFLSISYKQQTKTPSIRLRNLLKSYSWCLVEVQWASCETVHRIESVNVPAGVCDITTAATYFLNKRWCFWNEEGKIIFVLVLIILAATYTIMATAKVSIN